MNPILIKLISSAVAGVLALVLCKAYDMFYNLQYTKTEYIKSFVAGFIIAFVSLFAFEFITSKISQPSGVNQTVAGSVSEVKLSSTGPSMPTFKYNTGMPNF
jgi:hypothetical protein